MPSLRFKDIKAKFAELGYSLDFSRSRHYIVDFKGAAIGFSNLDQANLWLVKRKELDGTFRLGIKSK